MVLVTGKFVYNPEFLYLTTTGRKTGQPREIEIWFAAYEGCYYICAEGREKANWVQNIQHNLAVTFWVEGRIYQGKGRSLDSNVDAELWAAVAERFDAKYQWSDGLMVELCPKRS
jgi:deazaflavin-dependent oxidoreductase (nitroreductase family)